MNEPHLVDFIAHVIEDCCEGLKEPAQTVARKVISAIYHPTEEMKWAGYKAGPWADADGSECAGEVWEAMIDKAVP
jgi:hypothetical protein